MYFSSVMYNFSVNLLYNDNKNSDNVVTPGTRPLPVKATQRYQVISDRAVSYGPT